VAKPTKITCVGMHLGDRSAVVRCDLPFLGRRAAFLHTRGKARIKSVPRLAHPSHPRRLGRGQQIRLDAFTCTSLRRAVTCRSRNGHGFTVGKSFQLTF